MTTKTYEEQRNCKIEWAEFTFPPINLLNVWPSKEMCAIHAEQLDPDLWKDTD